MAISVDLDLSEIFTDVFDIKKDDTTKNDYGKTVAVGAVTVASSVSGKLLPIAARRGGREFKVDKKGSMADFTLYMFPIDGVSVDEHMWVFLNGRRYDITLVVQPVVDGAPLEVYLELVKP